MLLQCLHSVFSKITDIEYEVLVLDNASEDDTIDAVRNKYPSVILVENKQNRGVAPARNQLIKMAKGRYVLILDADTEIVSNNFEDLLGYMDEHKDVGILGCSLVSFDNKLHPSARSYPRPIHIFLRRLSYSGFMQKSKILKEHHLDSWDRKHPAVVDFVEGAFQLTRREAIEKVGLLDESMFYGFEDADYCARMEKAGYKVVCYPSFIVKHFLHGVTRRNPFNKMAYLHTKSYIIFYKKHKDLIKSKSKKTKNN
jgi:GT2 family glycosyltransferase